jgi:thiol-disulfide isomerase/thioredoxin
MIERLLIIVVVAGVIALVWMAIRTWRMWRLHSLARRTPFAGIIPTGKPAVVGFSTPGCVECRTRQAPALARLSANLGDQATVRTLPVSEYPLLVDQLGILTAPATVVIDATGVVRFVNLGFADAEKLATQVNSIAHPVQSNPDPQTVACRG